MFVSIIWNFTLFTFHVIQIFPLCCPVALVSFPSWHYFPDYTIRFLFTNSMFKDCYSNHFIFFHKLPTFFMLHLLVEASHIPRHYHSSNLSGGTSSSSLSFSPFISPVSYQLLCPRLIVITCCCIFLADLCFTTCHSF